MLGIVFTELLDMVEEKFGPDMVDDIIEDAQVTGAYTSVGNYAFSDLIGLVGALEKRSSVPAATLIEAYGQHLFGRFSTRYPDFFAGHTNALDFLQGIEARIHTQVRKLYPGAELPSFVCERPNNDTLVMHYHSPKCLGHLAVGLIKGCGIHFSTPLAVAAASELGSQDNTFTVRFQ